ncbi:uncharacterized protein LOC116346445 [Contarinia nasturtii]|uniref:uncharacterized protein LOC116346445 n=1 Tax=Contarinia nasturtii TaxID=265458 RepID=UPI0012D3FB2A|nr:uncharacterized protein LOC116346445 [Contarinia nasturtii]
MEKSHTKSHWGECPEIYDSKYEVQDVFSIYPPEKRFKIEMLGAIDEPHPVKTVQIENHLVTQTVELLNHTNRIKSMIEMYSEEMVYLANQRQVLPTITLSADTKACLEELHQPITSPFETHKVSDFTLGKPKAISQINKPVVMDVIGKALTGLLRIKGFDYCTESGLLMFKDAIEEFYKCFMEKINQVVVADDKGINKKIDIDTLEKAYKAMSNSSLLNLHNYYKNEIINRNRSEIIRFKSTQMEYEKLVEESEKIQKFNLKEEYMNMMNNISKNDMSPSSSNPNDSDASSSFSFKDSNMSYDMKQQSDENTNLSFSMSQ